MSSRVITQLTVGEERDVTLRFQGSLNCIVAKALETEYNQDGQLTRLLLDRKIHSNKDERFERYINLQWQSSLYVSGCYVTELQVRCAAT